MSQPDLSRLTRLGVRITRVESVDGLVTWSFRASPFPRVVKGAGLCLLLLVTARTFVGPYQWLVGGLLAAWAAWMLLGTPIVRLHMGRHQCVLSREALILWLVPICLPSRTIGATAFEVWRLGRIARIALGARTTAGRLTLWTFPEWINMGKRREETGAAAERLAAMLRRDLRMAGQLVD